MDRIDTTFECWQIRWDANLINGGVILIWQVASRYDRDCLVIQLLSDRTKPLAEVAVFTGGQVEVTTQIPLTVYADPRAAILSLELAGLYAVQNGVLSVEPD